MGFFDKLKDAWTDWDFDWGQAKEGYKTAGKEAWGGLLNTWAGTFNLISSGFRDDMTARAALANYGKAFNQETAALGGLGQGMYQTPFVRLAIGTVDWAQQEIVKRPLSTGLLMSADATNEGSFPFFDTERWRRAYNTTKYVTPGQSWFYNLAANAQASARPFGVEFDDMQRRDILRQFPTLGVLAGKPSDLDPRDLETRKQYYSNGFMKGMSGSMDVAITMFADPTIVGTKFAMWGKGRYFSQKMNAAAVQAGKHVDYQSSPAYARAKEFVHNADSSAKVELTMFNNHYNGSTASGVLWEAAHSQKKYDELGGTLDLYDKSYLALYGDADAFDALAQEAPRLADAIGSKFANYSIGHAGREYGLGDKALDAQWDALRETRTAAWIDAFANGHGLYGQLKQSVQSGGFLLGQPVPRLRMSSKWRAGVHQWARPAPATSVGEWVKRHTASYLLPSNRRGRMLDMEDAYGARQLRANLEHSRLPQAEVDKWVSTYGQANSRQSRFGIYNGAENAAFRSHALHYGMSTEQVEALLPQINKWRTGNRQVMSSSRRFLSADVRKEAKARIEQGRKVEGDELNRKADEIDAAVKRGDMPAATYHLPDENGGLAVIPEDADISTTGPVLISQHAEVVPMMDWDVLDNALWWNSKGGFGKHVYQSKDAMRSALDTLMSTWKISAILRPGYIPRSLSDEQGRVWAVIGAARAFMGAVGGAKNSAYNMSSRGRILGEVIADTVTRRKARGETRVDVDAEIVDQAATMPAAPAVRLGRHVRFGADRKTRTKGDELVYRSYEQAFADGVLSVDDLLERVGSHGPVGSLPPRMADIYHGYTTAGAFGDRLYRRYMVDEALRSVDRGVYTSPAWQQSVLDTVQELRRSKAPGEVGAGLMVDPFTGISPKASWLGLQKDFTMQNSRVVKPGKDGVFEFDDVYDFIADNVDELLKPGSLLSAYQRPDGLIGLSIARVNAEAAERLAVKPSGGRRIKWPLFGREGRYYRDSGSASYRLNTAAGPITIHGSFEGQGGDLFRQQTSSRGVEEAWTETLANTDHERLMAKSGRWDDITPDKVQYPDVWERAVNLQLANDPVAQMFLAGRSRADVIAWLHNAPEGRAYNWKMGPWRSRYAEQVIIAETMVDMYVPMVPGMLDESKALRGKVLAGKATFADFEKIMNREDMPRVHGASIEAATGKGAWSDWIRKRVDTTFKWLSDIPNDKFVRHPFAAERYNMHIAELVANRAEELKKRGNTFGADDLHAIEKQARARANMDVKKYLYESVANHDIAKAFRLIVPFGSAIADSTVKWGVVIRENPHVAVQLWKIWQSPDRAGLVQDEDGNQLRLEDGKEVWYQVHPETGEETRIEDPGKKRMVVFRLPSWLGPEYAKGVQPVTRIDKNVFRTFLDMPTFGPLVSVPANEFSLKNPEFADNKFVRTFILPFGPSEDWKKAGVPGNVRNVWEKFVEGDAGEEFETSAASIFGTEMVRHARGERADPPTLEEARAKASDMRGLRFMYRWMGVSAQFVSPYQPYIDYYHTLKVQDPRNADERFYNEMGTEFFALTASVTRNSMGLPATVGAFNQHKKFQQLMDQFPELSSLIAGEEGAGEFSRAVYEGQKQTPVRFGAGGMMRERMNPDDSWADMERRRGWIEYQRFADALHADMVKLGVNSLNQKAAAPLKRAKERWVKAHTFVNNPYGGTVLSPWYQDFSTFDTSKMTGRLHELRQIVQDPRLQGRDDMRGLIDYLHMRSQFKQYMQANGYKTLESKKAATLSRQWDATVFQLKNQNLSFSSLYDRWLANDSSLAAM